MKLNFLNKVSAVALVTAAGVATAGGGGFGNIVYDPTNWMRNSVTAASSIQQVEQLAQQYVAQLEQKLMMKLNMQNLPPELAMQLQGQIQQKLNTMTSFTNATQTLYGDMNTVQGNLQNRYDQAQVAGLTWPQYVQSESAAIQAKNQAAIQRAQVDSAAIQKVQDDYGQVQQWETQIPSNIGMQQSLQLMNSQMNRVITQNAAILQQLAIRDQADQASAVEKSRHESDLSGVEQQLKSQRDEIDQSQNSSISRLLQQQ